MKTAKAYSMYNFIDFVEFCKNFRMSSQHILLSVLLVVMTLLSSSLYLPFPLSFYIMNCLS